MLTWIKRRKWFGYQWLSYCGVHEQYDSQCFACEYGYWTKDTWTKK